MCNNLVLLFHLLNILKINFKTKIKCFGFLIKNLLACYPQTLIEINILVTQNSSKVYLINNRVNNKTRMILLR